MKILVLDDDVTILTLLNTVLRKTGHDIFTYNSPQDALRQIEKESFDLIISDLMMPEMSGEEFFKHVKHIKPEIPFLFLTADHRTETVIRVMKLGADDYIEKPIQPEEIQKRVLKVVEDKKRDIIITNTIIEDKMEKRQQQQLVSWKQLYGMKDTAQTDKVMKFLSRNIEHTGGFGWLPMLEQLMEIQEGDELTVSRNLINLIMESAQYINTIITDLSYISNLQTDTLLLEFLSLEEFIDHFQQKYEDHIIPLAAKHNKKISREIRQLPLNRDLEIDIEHLERIFNELICNCIKYSPEESKIMIHLDPREIKGKTFLEISFWNQPLEISNSEGKSVIGIPYEYTESVFELFYTIDNYPKRIPEEEWSQGSGLYIVRKLLQKMNGEINTRNVVIHTPFETLSYVKTTVYLPLL